jgi:hypothetical protein
LKFLCEGGHCIGFPHIAIERWSNSQKISLRNNNQGSLVYK